MKLIVQYFFLADFYFWGLSYIWIHFPLADMFYLGDHLRLVFHSGKDWNHIISSAKVHSHQVKWEMSMKQLAFGRRLLWAI